MEVFGTLLFGIIVGLSLGLTGGGGSILAVPMLVFGVHMTPKTAALVSLVAVGGVALVGAVRKLRTGEVEWTAGTALGIGGVLGAPAGIWLSQFLPSRLMLLIFSALMVLVAAAMWLRASRQGKEATEYRDAAFTQQVTARRGATCSIHPSGKLVLTSRCLLIIGAIGTATGVMSGIFGVGGGFIIVPALTMIAGLSIRRAVATSMLAVGLVSLSSVASGILAGRSIPIQATSLFAAGGVAGLLAGITIGARLPAAAIQKIFSCVIAIVAVYVAVRALRS